MTPASGQCTYSYTRHHIHRHSFDWIFFCHFLSCLSTVQASSSRCGDSSPSCCHCWCCRLSIQFTIQWKLSFFSLFASFFSSRSFHNIIFCRQLFRSDQRVRKASFFCPFIHRRRLRNSFLKGQQLALDFIIHLSFSLISTRFILRHTIDGEKQGEKLVLSIRKRGERSFGALYAWLYATLFIFFCFFFCEMKFQLNGFSMCFVFCFTTRIFFNCSFQLSSFDCFMKSLKFRMLRHPHSFSN